MMDDDHNDNYDNYNDSDVDNDDNWPSFLCLMKMLDTILLVIILI